jgi:hypothetical protein
VELRGVTIIETDDKGRAMRTSQPEERRKHRKQIVILSYGLGTHSTAAAVNIIENEKARDFDLDQLILLTAMTGDEWKSSRILVETHFLPVLRAHSIRYVQVARCGARQADSIRVLSDTREPCVLHIEGVYKLSDELRRAGTVPTVCGTRKCSLKFKGWVLDQWIKQNFDKAYVRQIIGFHADEGYRVERERRYYSGIGPPIEHPLIRWGWNDEDCFNYLRERFGVEWKKSCCSFCMFANGKPEVIARFREEPEAAAAAVVLERTARALNPRMTLYSRRSVEELIEADGNTQALEIADEFLNSAEWKLIRVQRLRTNKGVAHRRTEELARGSRSEMSLRLEEMASRLKLPFSFEGGHRRLYLLRPQDGGAYPLAEEMLVIVPATVESKSRKNFMRRWNEIVGQRHLFRTAA